jgi:gluconolactonase
MRSLYLLPALAASCLFLSLAGLATAFEPGPDSKPQPGVPKGEVLKFSFETSKVFPGTYRDYWVYVPAQYSPDRPACLYVNQDGIQWNAPVVFDNLIAKKEMPVTIGVFIMHGRVRAQDGAKALDRFNRSYEYDGLGDSYARFLIEELLPDVETKKTGDGRPIRFSHEAKDHAIGGSSSGAVCAFTAAWERPDYFSRVFSAIGTYVGLRGADRYPTLVRKYEPKALRVFLQDGSNDLNIYAGDWWMANQMMERALTFSGYEVQHVWGEGGHSGAHGTEVFPDAMRWLWKGWPAPVGTGRSRNNMLNDVLVRGADWEPVGEAYGSVAGLAVNRQGEVLFSDVQAGKTYRIGANGLPELFQDGGRRLGQAFGPDGRHYALTGDGKLVSFDSTGKASTVASGVRGSDLAVANNGRIYVAEPGTATSPGKLWLIAPGGKKSVVDTGLQGSQGLTLSPDQTLLYATEGRTHWVYSYQVQPDGTLQAKQRYYWLHSPDDRDDSGSGSLCVDRDGRLYVATALGIQVADQAGRVNCILPVPGGAVNSVRIGGPGNDTLFAACAGRVYRRKIGPKGAHAWDTPNRPAPPGL